MGIVATCPNGHRIKVKDELAGRKGICPTCSARFRIPRKEAASKAPVDVAAVDRPPTARVVSLDPLAVASLPAALAIDEVDTVDTAEPAVELVDAVPDFAPMDDLPAVGEHRDDHAADEQPADEAGAEAAADDQADDGEFSEALPMHAVLDERPDLAWCVAIRGGAPSAPLDAEAMRTWLDSGAASADHVVWRQDWPDWRPVHEVFPDAVSPEPPGWP